MKEYTCETCGQVFKQKGHFTNHQKRKKPCKPNVIENKNINLNSNTKKIHKNMIDDNSTIDEINDEIAKAEILLKNKKLSSNTIQNNNNINNNKEGTKFNFIDL